MWCDPKKYEKKTQKFNEQDECASYTKSASIATSESTGYIMEPFVYLDNYILLTQLNCDHLKRAVDHGNFKEKLNNNLNLIKNGNFYCVWNEQCKKF